MPFEDQTLTCRDCGKSFVFSARDQEFYAEKGFTNSPTRCRDCRALRKKSPQESQTGDKTLYKIICKNCGKTGEMATAPRKPDDVLCSECFYDAFKQQITVDTKEAEKTPA